MIFKYEIMYYYIYIHVKIDIYAALRQTFFLKRKILFLCSSQYTGTHCQLKTEKFPETQSFTSFCKHSSPYRAKFFHSQELFPQILF